jgi:hypothetical protein
VGVILCPCQSKIDFFKLMKRRVKVIIKKAELPAFLQIINLMISEDNLSTDIITMAMSAAFRDMAEELQYKLFISGESEKVTMKFRECSAILFFGAFNGNALTGLVQEKLVADNVNAQIEEQLFKSGKYKFPQK